MALSPRTVGLPTLHSRSVTLFELLPGSAIARVVGFHFRGVADIGRVAGSLGTGDVSGCHRSCKRHAGSLSAGTLHFKPFEPLAFFLIIAGHDLKVKERLGCVSVDAIEHVLKHIERLFLVFHQRVLLSVTDQADALFDVVDRKQVILPLRVDDIEHDVTLIRTKRFGSR